LESRAQLLGAVPLGLLLSLDDLTGQMEIQRPA
jgi:hypothetical protein